MTHVKRLPLWQTTKRIDYEKPRKYEPNRKLAEFQKDTVNSVVTTPDLFGSF